MKTLCRGLLLAGCCLSSLATAQVSLAPQWQSPLLREHPLVGRIWDQQAGRFISEQELLNAITRRPYLLLGEKHDNPDHHALQRALLGQLASQTAAVTFEMMDSTQADGLASLARGAPGSLDELKARLAWDEDGWNWDFYGPLIHNTLAAGITVRAGNISTEEMRRVYSESLPAALEGVLQDTALASLNQEIDTSHCGQLPASQFPAMVRVQQSRDHRMASVMAQSAGPGVGILVAGNFHIRQDLGVPAYLLAAGAVSDLDEVVSLALLEVSETVTDPGEYTRGYGELSAYDFVWFTPKLTEEDYCAAFL